MNILAIIPARGGSKGLPGKNIRPLAGTPLIGHTIKAALEAESVDRVIVSTDDESIAAVARESGAEVPFLRPSALSDDTASGVDACLHALEYANTSLDYHPELVVYLQPTSPMRTAADIDTAVKLLHDSNADAVVSVKAVTEYPQWMKKMDDEQRISPLFEELEITTARQSLEKSYLLNGAIYLSTTESLKKYHGFYGGDTRGYLMPEDRSTDIDTLNDFLMAEALYKKRKTVNDSIKNSLNQLSCGLTEAQNCYTQFMREGKTFLLASKIKEANISILSLIEKTAPHVPEEVNAAFNSLATHIYSWIAQWDTLQEKINPKPEQPFVFQSKHPFPSDDEQMIVSYINNFDSHDKTAP